MFLKMIYELTSTVLKEDAIVDLKSNMQRFSGVFLDNNENDNFTKFTQILFVSQEGYTHNDMVTEDYLEASIGVPIFSNKFKNLIQEVLETELKLYPCKIQCNDEFFDFYVGKIVTYTDFVDTKNSIYRKLTDGRDVISIPRFKASFSDNLYIARDKTFPHLFAISQKFASVIEENRLRVGIKALN